MWKDGDYFTIREEWLDRFAFFIDSETVYQLEDLNDEDDNFYFYVFYDGQWFTQVVPKDRCDEQLERWES